jgi:hypothetical protein
VCFASSVARLTSARKTSVRLEALDRSYFNTQGRRAVESKYLVTVGVPRTGLGFFGLKSRSLSSFSRLVGLAQAARPLAGGSPGFARVRAVHTGRSVAALSNHACVW